MASGGAAGASSLLFVYSLDYARTRLANDAKAAKKGGGRQFNGLIDVYRKTLQTDGVAGLYRGFNISCVGIIVYRGLYFGMYDSLKPVVLVGQLQVTCSGPFTFHLFHVGCISSISFLWSFDTGFHVLLCKIRGSLLVPYVWLFETDLGRHSDSSVALASRTCPSNNYVHLL